MSTILSRAEGPHLGAEGRYWGVEGLWRIGWGGVWNVIRLMLEWVIEKAML